MRFSTSKILIFITLSILSLSALADRKPAIDDFVGVETANYQLTPASGQFSFNFGNHVSATSNSFMDSISTSQMISMIAIMGLLTLPFMLWVGIVRSANKTLVQSAANEETHEASSHEELENNTVASLEDYRKIEGKDKKAS